ncbi:MAG: M28 family peptidase [Actinomycetota bacterium]
MRLVSVRTPVGPSASLVVVPSFDGPRAAEFARRLAQLVPDRSPGSATAGQAADDVAGALGEISGETVRRATFTAPGPDGADVAMENVWVVEPGASAEAVVVVANRDDVAPGPGLDDNASGTAAVVELARDLAGVDRSRALVIASTDGGTVGQAGNERLLRDLRADGLRPIAVVSLRSIGGPTGTLPVRFAGTGGVRTPDVLLRGLQESLAEQQPVAGAVAPQSPVLQVLDLIAPVAPSGAQVPYLDAGIAAIQLGDGTGGVGLAPLDEARLGAVGAAIAQLLVRLDAEPRPAPPTGAYVAVSGRIIPGRAIGLLAIALLIGPLVAAGRILLAGGRPSRGGWGAALAVALVGAVPGVAAVLVARLVDLTGGVATAPGSGWPRADLGGVVAVVAVALALTLAAAWLLARRVSAPPPLIGAIAVGLVAALLLLAGSPASVLVAVPALWVWSLVPRPGERLGRLAWSLGPVLAMGLLIFLLRGADPATLIGAAATGALPPALVVGGSVLIGAGAVGALAED